MADSESNDSIVLNDAISEKFTGPRKNEFALAIGELCRPPSIRVGPIDRSAALNWSRLEKACTPWMECALLDRARAPWPSAGHHPLPMHSPTGVARHSRNSFAHFTTCLFRQLSLNICVFYSRFIFMVHSVESFFLRSSCLIITEQNFRIADFWLHSAIFHYMVLCIHHIIAELRGHNWRA